MCSSEGESAISDQKKEETSGRSEQLARCTSYESRAPQGSGNPCNRLCRGREARLLRRVENQGSC